jgi:hypothetical protein
MTLPRPTNQPGDHPALEPRREGVRARPIPEARDLMTTELVRVLVANGIDLACQQHLNLASVLTEHERRRSAEEEDGQHDL